MSKEYVKYFHPATQTHKSIAEKIGVFIEKTRNNAPPFYVVHAQEFLGFDEKGNILKKIYGPDDRAYALETSCGQNIMENDHVIISPEFDGFKNTDLLTRLEHMGCKTIFFSGFILDQCVKKTADAALAHGFMVVILEDLVGWMGSERERIRFYIDKQEGWKRMTSEEAEKRLKKPDLAPSHCWRADQALGVAFL